MNKKSHPAIRILEKYKEYVWPELKSYLVSPSYPELFKVPDSYKQDSESAYWSLIKEYPERKGKYVRPTIVLLVCEALGVDKSKALKTATAMQVSEEWLLIHDDFEDNSTTRRGKPTLHRAYGNELAVNAGDALHIIMWKILLDNFDLLGEKKALQIANEFYIMLSRTALGQAVEIKWMVENKMKLEDKDWFFIADGKTSYYTMAGPARLGGIVAGADSKKLDKLSEFGISLGRCFQLVDDLLDITGDFSGLKQMANDVYEGKRTLILGHLSRKASIKDKKNLNNILKKGRDEKTDEEVKWVIDKMHSYGSIDYAWEIAKKLKDDSLFILDNKLQFLKDKDARSKIRTLVNFILERKH